jgi:predicted nucleic acid-binding protein
VAWAWLRRAVERSEVPSVSAVTVAETWRAPPRALLARALAACDIEPVDESLAKSAGAAIGATGADVSDAIVATSAARAGRVLVTTDLPDMRALAGHLRSLRVVGL